MKKVERKLKITQLINKKGKLSVEELAENFNVTPETIRRDLNALHKESQLQKIHGGAVCLEHNTESSLDERFYLNVQAKENIAQKAVKYIKPFSRIFIDFGSTTLAFSEALKHVDNLEIFTNSPLLAKTIKSANNTHQVYILGGLYLTHMHQNVGYMTLDSINDIFVDLAVVSTAAIDMQNGFFNINNDEAQIAKAMIQNAKKCMILADNSKLKLNGLIRTCTFAQVHYLVSDEKDTKMQNVCEKFNIAYI